MAAANSLQDANDFMNDRESLIRHDSEEFEGDDVSPINYFRPFVVQLTCTCVSVALLKALVKFKSF